VVGGTDGHYAKSGDLYIRYEVTGDGPIDLLALSNGSSVWVDRDDEPHWSRFDRRLAAFSRLLRFDPSGVGLSDPLNSGEMPSSELWTQDAIAVLDAVGSARPALFGVGLGGIVAMLLSATYPERTSALVLMHSWSRLIRDEDYPWGIPQHVVDRFVSTVANPSSGDNLDDLAMMAPTLADDPEFRSWWSTAGERSAGPRIAQAINMIGALADIRAILPLIRTPTLILHRAECGYIRPGHGRYLADHIAGAKLVELDGQDYLPYAGDIDPVVDEIEEFLTGARAAPRTDRILATILFTDIVDSTKRAAASGDRRWHELLDNHDRMTVRQIQRFGGRQVKTTGDGALATFDGPARAIQCGLAIVDGARQLGIDVRIGLHTGEVERRGDDIAGIAVHIASRVQSHAEAGEVWVSRTVTDLVAGSSLRFSDRGEHALKGVPGTWQLFVVDT
jgi:class 3 adenylate cyclase/pimeloyl-ACP methyl ester carboxylesterase